MDERVRRLADKAEEFMLMIRHLEDDPPKLDEYRVLEAELTLAINKVRSEET